MGVTWRHKQASWCHWQCPWFECVRWRLWQPALYVFSTLRHSTDTLLAVTDIHLTRLLAGDDIRRITQVFDVDVSQSFMCCRVEPQDCWGQLTDYVDDVVYLSHTPHVVYNKHQLTLPAYQPINVNYMSILYNIHGGTKNVTNCLHLLCNNNDGYTWFYK